MLYRSDIWRMLLLLSEFDHLKHFSLYHCIALGAKKIHLFCQIVWIHTFIEFKADISFYKLKYSLYKTFEVQYEF